LIGGVAAMFLGLSVFRVGRSPVWAKGLITITPNYALGAVAAALGVLVIFIVVVV